MMDFIVANIVTLNDDFIVTTIVTLNDGFYRGNHCYPKLWILS
jgi:hypothetical protein